MEDQELLDKLDYEETECGLILHDVKDEFRDNLTELIVPESWNVVEIGSDWRKTPYRSGFNDMKNLKTLLLPGTVRILKDSSFSSCPLLSNITLSGGITSIGFSVFKNTAFYKDDKNWDETGTLYIGEYLIESKCIIKNFVVREGTTLIAGSACSERGLRSLSLPSTLRYVCNGAFWSNKSLTTVTFLSDFCCLAEDAFAYCNELKIKGGAIAFDVEKNEKGYEVIKESKIFIPKQQMEKTLEFLKDYDLLIDITEEDWGDDSDDDRAPCYRDSYNRSVCCKVDFAEKFRFLAFHNGELFGIVFIIEPEQSGYYGRIEYDEWDKKNKKSLFSFDGTSRGYFHTGWDGSHLGHSLDVHRVKLVKKDSDEAKKLGERQLSKFFLSPSDVNLF